ncbi:MAG: class I SAM-dependent methyltransferase [Alphaproteobacteria bacterium]|jgi:ubiquinone/menaquinone biosynthesis C-methylase UbiE|nr:class I SAM-dependent methyltransferase [Alphaproteobacteria bacterium]MBT4019870.1 class I SAM-dependent methyltransferase [Alphaproteobacteria bacterium]MBT4966135.1 class I SAM-dependent methyltransferase [Alphaproteobacteria bacterium]MBT5159405.1 class I SAM-dependent methyltransferase [Alphaproteobacteria bacterium]MBT7747020.1 class I SAM-dependent methyltransferase [Alphaproteobacteria bacterium]
MDDEYLALLVDLHKRQNRQGPGGQAETSGAMTLANLHKPKPLNIADIGCGTGASTLQLANSLNAKITAVDFLPEFIEALKDNAEAEGLSEKIETLVCSMEQLPFAEEEYDVFWSEGAIYNMGFEKGLKEWRRFLKPDGILAVSEITWITNSRPPELQEYWEAEYPEIATASTKIKVLEENGYAPIGYFVLPESCWLENYYRPLQEGFPDFLARHEDNEMATSIIDAEKNEIALYKKYKSCYSYGMYVAQKIG